MLTNMPRAMNQAIPVLKPVVRAPTTSADALSPRAPHLQLPRNTTLPSNATARCWCGYSWHASWSISGGRNPNVPRQLRKRTFSISLDFGCHKLRSWRAWFVVRVTCNTWSMSAQGACAISTAVAVAVAIPTTVLLARTCPSGAQPNMQRSKLASARSNSYTV